MSNGYGYDFIDGCKMPQLVVDADYTLVGNHQGTVHVERGTFTLQGTLQGSLDVHQKTTATIVGKQQGSVFVAPGAVIIVTGAIEGSTTIEQGGTVIVEAPGKLAGSLCNDGLLVVRGVFGGSQSGRGEVRLEGAGHVKEPRVVNGVSFYDW
jgi:hypothetical protein